jgi:hypothetical protein
MQFIVKIFSFCGVFGMFYSYHLLVLSVALLFLITRSLVLYVMFGRSLFFIFPFSLGQCFFYIYICMQVIAILHENLLLVSLVLCISGVIRCSVSIFVYAMQNKNNRRLYGV